MTIYLGRTWLRKYIFNCSEEFFVTCFCELVIRVEKQTTWFAFTRSTVPYLSALFNPDQPQIIVVLAVGLAVHVLQVILNHDLVCPSSRRRSFSSGCEMSSNLHWTLYPECGKIPRNSFISSFSERVSRPPSAYLGCEPCLEISHASSLLALPSRTHPRMFLSLGA